MGMGAAARGIVAGLFVHTSCRCCISLKRDGSDIDRCAVLVDGVGTGLTQDIERRTCWWGGRADGRSCAACTSASAESADQSGETTGANAAEERI